MFGLQIGELVVFAIALFAATVNGALGYGFSSLTVPVALSFFSNKVLSPALVLVELVISGHHAWTEETSRFTVRSFR